jgi:protein-tyrosine phosphatase
MVHNFSWVIPGRLAGAALPGSGYRQAPQYVLSDLRELRDLGVRCLVSLTQSASFLGPLCEQAGLEWLFSPIPEFGIPENNEAFHDLVETLLRRLERGLPVCAHCYAGVGRTGLLLCCLVGRHLGLPAGAAIRRVRAVRPAIETSEQERFVRAYLEAAAGGSG